MPDACVPDALASVASWAPNFLKANKRVRHVARNETGTVESVTSDGTVTVVFDNPVPRGGPSRGVYDRNWFRMYPQHLVELPMDETPAQGTPRSHPEIELARRNAEGSAAAAWGAVLAHVEQYVADYETTCDPGYYRPNEHERGLIEDAIQGLLADDDFLKKIGDAVQIRRFAAFLRRRFDAG